MINSFIIKLQMEAGVMEDYLILMADLRYLKVRMASNHVTLPASSIVQDFNLYTDNKIVSIEFNVLRMFFKANLSSLNRSDYIYIYIYV